MQSLTRVSRAVRSATSLAQTRRSRSRFNKTWSTQHRTYSQGSHQRVNFEDESLYSKNPVENLPPELRELEPVPKRVWLGAAVLGLCIVAAVPWESWRDHIFFPPEEEDD